MEHDEEGHIIEDGAQRADVQDEPLDLVDGPFPGFGQKLLVHIVCGDSLRIQDREVRGMATRPSLALLASPPTLDAHDLAVHPRSHYQSLLLRCTVPLHTAANRPARAASRTARTAG